MDTESVQTPSRRGAVKTPPTMSLFQRTIRLFYRFILLILLVLLIVIAGGAYMLGRASVYKQYPQLNSIETANDVLTKVAQLIQLPQNETPSMVAIDDAATVKKEPFLANAQNHDVLIIYTTAGFAILYRPSSNKLIAVGPVSNQPAASAHDTVRTAPASDNAITDDAHATTSNSTE